MNTTNNKVLMEYVIRVFIGTELVSSFIMMCMIWFLSNSNMREIHKAIDNYGQKTIAANTLANQASTDIIIQQHLKTEVLVIKLQKEIESLKLSIAANKVGLQSLEDKDKIRTDAAR